jgi:hypothetical protein
MPDERVNVMGVISITGWQGDDNERLSKKAGCDYHLLKPLDPFLLEFLRRGEASQPKTTLDEV